MIEQIKHLFSVPGITFLLVVNREQLEESIKSKYGRGVKATSYLQKFINLWLSLPRKSDYNNDDGEKYLNHIFHQMLDEDEKIYNEDAIKILLELTKYLKPSLREIEQILSYFAIIQNMRGNTDYHSSYQAMIAFICFLKVSHPKLINQIESENITTDELINSCGLPLTFQNEYQFTYIQFLYDLIRYDLSTEDERREIINQNPNTQLYRNVPNNLMKIICNWLSEISN